MPCLPRILRVLPLAVVALLSLGVPAAEPGPPPGTASAVIRAADYENLQAVLDAVPEGGGLVVLPPGRFLIDRPLLLTRGETRIVGAGAATCLVNTNQSGEPTLVVRRPRSRKIRGLGSGACNWPISGSAATRQPSTARARSRRAATASSFKASMSCSCTAFRSITTVETASG